MKPLITFITSLLFTSGIFSCSFRYNSDDFDAQKNAAEYCACLKEHNAPYDWEFAKTVCNAELIKKNRYYRIFCIDMEYSTPYYKTLSQQTKDSTLEFIYLFEDYTKKNCCKEDLKCDSVSIK